MNERPEHWIMFADGDYEAARSLKVKSNPVLRGIAAFHAQQAAEKYLKAALVAKGKPVPRIHDLVSILQRLAGDVPAIEGFKEALAQLSIWAVIPRYPGDYPEVFIQEIDEALTVVEKLRELVLAEVD